MYLSLIRKDLRLLRPAIVAAILIALFCDGVLPIAAYAKGWHDLAAGTSGEPPDRQFWRMLADVGIPAFVLSLGFAAVFGGAAVTIERRERWGDLAAMLPISRSRRSLVSLAAGATLFAATFAFHAAVLWIAVAQLERETNADVSTTLRLAALLSVALFGVAWLASAFARSPTIAAATSIGLVVGGLIVTWSLPALLDAGQPPSRGIFSASWNPEAYVHAYIRAIATVGALATVAGTVCLARRVEP